MSLFWFIVLPLLTALISYLSYSRLAKLLILGMQGFFLVMAVMNFIKVRTGGAFYEVIGGYDLGIGISLKADLFSSVMVVLTVFLFTCLLIYNYHKSYMNHLFLFLFLILQGLLCGFFLSNDLFNIYVLIEVSTIVVSILIVYKKDSQSIYDGMIYLFTNLASMTLFLLGLGYLYKIFGTLDLTLLKERVALIENPSTLILPFVLIVTAVDLKSAIMPLFSWLPKAHGTASAPSIVSAILSGLYVKGGIYLFIRIMDLFEPVFPDHQIFILFGFLTAIIGCIFALCQTDIKLILAYSTVSQIGLIVFGLSTDNIYGYWGSIYHILNHAIFKSVLFLCAGMIIDEYRTRDIRQIKGLFKRMPYVTIVMLIAIFGITGAPLFNGSFSKYLIQKGGQGNPLYEWAFFFINVGTITIFVRYLQMMFGGWKGKRAKMRLNQSVIIMLLAVICFIGGVMGPYFMGLFFDFHVDISVSSYVGKLFSYLLSLAIGVCFYLFVYHRIAFFRKIRELELSYNQIVFSMIIFYSGFLMYMMMRYA